MIPPIMFQGLSKKRQLGICRAFLVLGSLCASSAQSRAQDAPPRKPATVDEAAKVLDLQKFPLAEGAEVRGPRRMASLFYEAKGGVKQVFDSQRQLLVAKGWKESPDGYISDESASGTFSRDGYVASLSVSPGDAKKPGSVHIMLQQQGNVDLAKLPVPPGSKPLYAGLSTAMFVTDDARDNVAKACRELLLARGWQPYGTAGDSLIFKQNAVRLNAMISTAPAQDGKTMIQYSAELLSADLPAPPDSVRSHYADTNTALEFDAKGSPEALVDFYRETLGKNGWKATTEKSIKTGDHEMLIFRNPKHDMLALEFFPFEGVLRGNLKHQTAAEVEEEERLANEQATRKKALVSREPKAKPTVTISLPAGSQNVEQQEDGDIEFTVSSGKAKSAVEELRKTLKENGWKEDVASLEKQAGAVSLSKEASGSLTIHYTDIGVMPAEISITGFGVVIERLKHDAK
jgi:hypothetical protein